MSWWKNDRTNQDKDTLRSNEYDKCLTKFAELFAETKTLALDIKLLRTDLDNLRGNFSRKLRGLKTEEEQKKEEEKVDEPKTINTTEYIAFG